MDSTDSSASPAYPSDSTSSRDRDDAVAAGDPFIAAGRGRRLHDDDPDQHHLDDRDERLRCFACYEGVVYIGHMVPLPDGDEEEVYTAYPCRLCGGTGRLVVGEDV